MMVIGDLREQDVAILEGQATTMLTLLATIRSLQAQLDAVDRALGPEGRGNRVGTIKGWQEQARKYLEEHK